MYTVIEFMPITQNGKLHTTHPLTSMSQWKIARSVVAMEPTTRMYVAFQLGFIHEQPVSNVMPPPSPSATSMPLFRAGDYTPFFRISHAYIPRNVDEMQPKAANTFCRCTSRNPEPEICEKPFSRRLSTMRSTAASHCEQGKTSSGFTASDINSPASHYAVKMPTEIQIMVFSILPGRSVTAATAHPNPMRPRTEL